MDWQRVRPLLEQLLDLPEQQREAAIARESAGDPELGRRLRAMLAAGGEHSDAFEPVTPDGEASVGLGAGDRVGAWRLVSQLGEGGMGRVWLAERVESGYRQRAALKLVKRGLDTDAVLRRFRRERQLLADLEHPGIVHLIDGGSTADGRPYLVVELVEGTPIDVHCKTRGLPLEDRLELFARVCEAVEAAHRLGIVHRDLKPANLLVTAAGEPKVLDFGIAKVLGDDGPEASLLTRTGERLLTPRYAAPEQVLGQECSTATDVYALGMVMYELLCGCPPYELDGATLREIETAVCGPAPRRPSARADRSLYLRLRGDLDVIALRALAKEPERRYRDAGQLAREVRRHLANQPIEARPDSSAYKLAKYISRNRVLVASGLMVVLALTAGLVSSERQRRLAHERAVEAEWSAYVAMIRGFQATLALEGNVSTASSPGQPVHRGWEWQHLQARAALASHELYAGPGRVEGELAVDGSGRLLAFVQRGEVVVIDTVTTAERTRLEVAGARRPALSADGALLAFATPGRVHLHDLSSGAEVAAFDASGVVERIRFFATKPALLVADKHRVFEQSLERPEARRVLADWKSAGLALHPDEDRIAVSAKDGLVHVIGLDDPDLSFSAPLASELEVACDLDFSSSGRFLAAASKNGVARIWNVADQSPASLPLHTEEYCTSIAFRFDRDELLVPTTRINIWDAETGRQRELGAGETINNIVASPVAPVFFTSQNGRILEWSANAQPVPRHRLADAGCYELSASPQGERYVVSTDRDVLLVEIASGEVLARRELAGVEDLVHLATGEVVCAGATGLAVLSGEDLDRIAEASIPDASSLALDPDGPDGAVLYVGTRSGGLFACRTGDWSVTERAPTPFERIAALAVHPSGRRLTAIGVAEVEAHDLDLGSGRWTPHEARLDCTALSVAISPDGRLIAVGGNDRLQVRSSGSGALLCQHESAKTRAVLFTPDAKRLLAVTHGKVNVFDTVRWDLVITLRGNGRGIQGMDLSPDGTLLTSDWSGDVVVWLAHP